MLIFAILILVILIWPLNKIIDNTFEKVNLPLSQSKRVKCESPIERRLYDALVFNDYYVETQYTVGKYRIDLAIPPLKLAIECDGKEYHSFPHQKENDRRKDKYLRSEGWKVLRFTGRQINRNINAVLFKIEKHATLILKG
ncbi:DUF559 domain-containing protein (plasmid) [Alkalihalobacillus hwajinpoensis]|uniref:endonuclease domain-containing protein n=1 Tax=Guptibacillus hwajinpoensis TaxID=208199 RepID=UPI001883F634|nr:DUF559 domain-containing protein [Pseudalkalibacillus hwajinpoensis]MBF0706785.1 DUF559 domain-containing protein [Pseudalkalibacillus hwajinpoensis]